MTEQDLRAIEARADAAPKGPYWASTEADGHWLNNDNVLRRDESGDLCVILQANHYFQPTFPLLDFVAEARQDIPALVAEVRRLRAQVDAMTELVKDLAKQQREEFHRLDYYEITTQELDRILNGESEGA